MVNWNLYDTSFSHQEFGSCPGKKPKFINWIRGHHKEENPTFYTHEQMLANNIFGDSYGLLIESQSIIPYLYEEVPKYMDKFKLVFTHSSELLKNFSNVRFIPGSSIWVGGDYGGGEIKLYNKTRNISILSSNKSMCKLHVERSRLVNSIRQYGLGVDIYGTLTSKWCKVIETLADYRYSIVIENHVGDSLYFTEKILNCFATGTIPVYYGARNIGEKFNIDGIIQLKNLNDIWSLYSTLTEDLYYSKYDAIEDNFERCKQYDVLEDYIYENYFSKEI